MRPFVLLALIGVIATASACPSPKQPSSPAGKVLPANADACPATFATAKGACDADNALCQYPEGACSCSGGSYCAGVAPSPEMQAEMQKMRWVCHATPPEVRADGCPGVQPTNQASCANEGQACSYGDCCIVPVRCTEGHWRAGSPSCPP